MHITSNTTQRNLLVSLLDEYKCCSQDIKLEVENIYTALGEIERELLELERGINEI